MLLSRTTWHRKRGFFKHTWEVMFYLLQSITCQLFIGCYITLTKRPISRPMCKIKLLFIPQLTAKTPKSFKIFTLLQFTFKSFDINFFNWFTFLLNCQPKSLTGSLNTLTQHLLLLWLLTNCGWYWMLNWWLLLTNATNGGCTLLNTLTDCFAQLNYVAT